MQLIAESTNQFDYLCATEELDYNHPEVAAKSNELRATSSDDMEFIQNAFHYVRDAISHSWDIQSSRITRTASEVLLHREGICYAKSNLLAAMLRLGGIPAGFCYQRLTIGDTPDTGYCIHALNAVHLSSHNRWVRLDARGNKPGVQAEFSVDQEQLAFPVREHYGEIDYPTIYKLPNPKTMNVLLSNTNTMEMYMHKLPTEL